MLPGNTSSFYFPFLDQFETFPITNRLGHVIQYGIQDSSNNQTPTFHKTEKCSLPPELIRSYRALSEAGHF